MDYIWVRKQKNEKVSKMRFGLKCDEKPEERTSLIKQQHFKTFLDTTKNANSNKLNILVIADENKHCKLYEQIILVHGRVILM
jgi:hypothetical protein